MIKTIFIILIVTIFSACSMKVIKPISRYTIDVNNKDAQVTKYSEKIIKMSQLKSPKHLQNTHIWYMKSDKEINSYIYSIWNDDFVDLIENSLLEVISDSGVTIYSRYSKIRSNLVLEGELTKAVQYVHNNNAEVLFNITLYLIDKDNYKLIDSKEFSYTKKCDNADAKGAIKAYDEIVTNLNKDVVLWLKHLVKEN